tara:strand:+ start:188 stop:448 length:261 start_codon:yes stop_codon:yes gene_type:complete
MKKLLAIVVLGLLYSCSDNEAEFKKKSKMIETCADYEYPKNFRSFSIKGVPLKAKLEKKSYERVFKYCEAYLKKNAVTFKEKYLNK